MHFFADSTDFEAILYLDSLRNLRTPAEPADTCGHIRCGHLRTPIIYIYFSFNKYIYCPQFSEIYIWGGFLKQYRKLRN
ncbi:MAG: hypothetical protein A2Y58_03170 [Chloroflexi bacterium RBG_13_51_52]|nr:MAG: hypothetical protein A2Y58_03170 [Chloroflexi bacterium RBG_13_51_52]